MPIINTQNTKIFDNNFFEDDWRQFGEEEELDGPSYQEQLEAVPINEIEKFLRKKKLDNIKKKK